MDSFEQFKNLISSINIDPVIAVGVLVIITTFVIECILLSKGYFKINDKKRMEKAIARNHTIKATRVSYWDDYVPGEGAQVNSWYHAKYEYTINNKKKTYRYLSKKMPPMILTLYYISNPNKVFHYEEKKSSILYLLMYIIPFALGIIVMKLLGFNPQ